MSLIQVSNLTFAYNGSYETIFDHVSFQIDTDWKLGFTGRNGRGKTTFLNLLQGKYDYQGSISASVEFSYFPYTVADKSRLAVDVVEEIHPEYRCWRLAREGDIDESLFFAILSKLDVPRAQLERDLSSLSAGQKKKVLLARSICQKAHLHIWDEPLNYIDVLSRVQIEELLLSFRPTILFVEHDKTFCRHIATKTIFLGGEL